MNEKLLKGQGYDHVGNPEDWGYTQQDVDNMLRDAKLYKDGYFKEDNFLESEDYVVFDDWTFGSFLNNVGTLYDDGVGVHIDKKEAAYWYQEAINNGENNVAGCNLGDMYRKGIGVEKDAKKAFEAYSSAEHPYAWYRVGEAYETGSGVTQDIEKAKEFYKASYNSGHRMAMKKLETFDFLS